jgi:hypothetical protein
VLRDDSWRPKSEIPARNPKWKCRWKSPPKCASPARRNATSPNRQQSEPFLLEDRRVIDFKGKGQVKTEFLGCRSADIITMMTAARRRSAK